MSSETGAPAPAVVEARGLDGTQLDAIAELERRVVAHDGGRLKLEWGVLRARPPGEVNDLLVWEGGAAGQGGTLAGFCGIYDFGGDPELAGAVDPDRRDKGIGSALLARALDLLAARGRTRALLVTPSATGTGRRFALARGATLDRSEHHLVLDGPPEGPPAARASTEGLVVRPVRNDDPERQAIVSILEAAFGKGAALAGEVGPTDLALVAERDDDVVATVRVDVGDGSAGVYGLAVRADLRGQGIGRAVLYEACLEAGRRGARKVTLEVETGNDHALGLYTSVGFERHTTEDYFALPVPGSSAASAGPS